MGMSSSQIDPAFAARRTSYDVDGIEAGDLAATPLEQFRRWYDAAVRASVPEPNAMTLATADAEGRPSARTVLLKHADAIGFVFFTNHGSRKGFELAANPHAAIVLAWIPQFRQVCVRGRVEQVPAATTREYFGSRPWSSRIGAWASRQSRTVGSRAELETRWRQFAERWPDRGDPGDVPVPPFWGGYVLRPVEVEFWQGRTSRMHDRLVFVPSEPGSSEPGWPPPALDRADGWQLLRREP